MILRHEDRRAGKVLGVSVEELSLAPTNTEAPFSAAPASQGLGPKQTTPQLPRCPRPRTTGFPKPRRQRHPPPLTGPHVSCLEVPRGVVGIETVGPSAPKRLRDIVPWLVASVDGSLVGGVGGGSRNGSSTWRCPLWPFTRAHKVGEALMPACHPASVWFNCLTVTPQARCMAIARAR